MTAVVRYEILGSPYVTGQAGRWAVSAPKVAVLLGVLVIRADQLVTTAQLTEEIWGDRAPRRARACLHVYVSQLRKLLSQAGADGSLVTYPPGYLLRLGSDEVDALAFARQVEEGRNLMRAQCAETASGCLERALGMWRGPVLGGAGTGPVVEGFAAWLDGLRMECVELLADAELALGRHRELVGRLFLLTAEHPLRERLYRYLMLALYRSGRRADALQVYHGARALLVREVGHQPGMELQELQRAILAADRDLDAQPGGSSHARLLR